MVKFEGAIMATADKPVSCAGHCEMCLKKYRASATSKTTVT
jgi:hypothetical protein